MSIESSIVDLSRLQFAITAIYHFLFVPLTIGLALLLGIMESVYVMTGKTIWRDMVKFWGKIFGINFAMGIATGITMEFQFGTNWGHYSHYVGDVFGVPLAIEGLMAFFLESTFVGMFFFGWNRLSRLGHLVCTWLMAIGANLSALWILIANGWMNYPVGAYFNPESMRMEVSSMYDIITSSIAQAKFVHTVSAAYVTGAVFVLSISCYFLLKKRHIEFAKRSIIVATSFGLLSVMSVLVLGDESGYLDGELQKVKMASIEAMWDTEPPPASFTVVGWPDQEKMETKYAIRIPYLMGIIGTRSLDKEIPGVKDLIKSAHGHILEGLKEYKALKRLKTGKSVSYQDDLDFLKNRYQYMGYALLLHKYRNDIENATPEEINKAAFDAIPNIWPVFFSFRIMVGCGLLMLLLMITSFYYMNIKRDFNKTWLLRFAFIALPLPWIAAESGWIVSECGRQPWVIYGILPTFMGVSSISKWNVVGSLIGFILLYTTLLVVDIKLIIKQVKKGPSLITKGE
jgi:cytochrome bd ubiquinol oxidase subunit I